MYSDIVHFYDEKSEETENNVQIDPYDFIMQRFLSIQ